MDPTRRALEDVWRERVRTALVCYRLAANETRLARTEQANGLTPEPDGFFAYRQALQKEKAALAEYRRVLEIFADLTVRSKLPQEDAAGGELDAATAAGMTCNMPLPRKALNSAPFLVTQGILS